MRKILAAILAATWMAFLTSSAAFPQDISRGRLNVREEDGSPDTFPWQARFPNGSVTDNGDGTTSISSSGAATTEPFVTIGNTAGLSAERALTGTANQVVVTDNGANSTAVLSTPQNIHTAANPQFGGLGIGVAGSAGTLNVQSASANALTVGANGTANPALRVDASAASAATGIGITSAAAASGVKLLAISSGVNESLYLDAKGSGNVVVGSSGTGNLILGGGASASELRFLEPSGSGSNYTALKAQAQAGDVTYTLPAADGTNAQVLSTNGSGTLSWSSAGSGDITSVGNVASGAAFDGTQGTILTFYNAGGNATLDYDGTDLQSSKLFKAPGAAFTDDVDLDGANVNYTLQHTGGDEFGLHTEAGSLLYLKNNTDNAYYLLAGGDHTMYYGTSGGSDSLVPSHIFRTSGGGLFRIFSDGSVYADKIGINRSPAAMLDIAPKTVSDIGVIIREAAGQTADRFQIRDNNETIRLRFNQYDYLIAEGGRIAVRNPAGGEGLYIAGEGSFAANISGIFDFASDGVLMQFNHAKKRIGFGPTFSNLWIISNQTAGAAGPICIGELSSAQMDALETACSLAVVNTFAASRPVVFIDGAASQTGDLTRWRNSAGTVLSNVDSSGIHAVPLGAVGGPGLTFVGDTDTGIWSSGANTLNLSTGGSERVRVDSTGNVGIGTTGPGSALDVKGTLRLSGATSGYVGLAPAGAAGSTTYTLPSSDGTNGQVLSTNGIGTLSWAAAGGSNHALLSATHTDTTAGTVARGDLITGQGVSATWTRLAIGTANKVLRSDGTDAVWAQVALATDVSGVLPVGNGGTGQTSWTANSLLYASATTTLASLGTATSGQIPIGSTGAAPVLAALIGTANQLTVTNGAGSITLSTPQDTHTAATPQFARMGLGAAASASTALLLPASSTTVSSARVGAGTAPTTPVEGDLWNDSTQKALIGYVDAIKQVLVGCIFTQDSSVTVSNTVTETTLLSTNVGTKTLPANFLVAGKTIRVKAWGYLTQDPLAPGGDFDLTWRVKLGSTAVLTTGAYTFGTAPTAANALWELEGLITCRTTGAAGTVMGQGVVKGNLNPGGLSSDFGFITMRNTTTSTIDTTASQAIDVTAQWSGADAADTITCTNVSLEVLN